jgi:hypothetical protein
MFGQIARAAVATFICIFVLGGTLEILRLIVGPSFSERGLFLLVIPMAAISWIAHYGDEDYEYYDDYEGNELAIEVIRIFVVVGAAIILANFFPLLLLFLFGGYIALYAKRFVIGWNYLVVRRPLEREAEKQAALSQKLDADSDLADAVLRHERARAALADAELAVREAEQGRGGGRR